MRMFTAVSFLRRFPRLVAHDNTKSNVLTLTAAEVVLLLDLAGYRSSSLIEYSALCHFNIFVT